MENFSYADLKVNGRHYTALINCNNHSSVNADDRKVRNNLTRKQRQTLQSNVMSEFTHSQIKAIPLWMIIKFVDDELVQNNFISEYWEEIEIENQNEEQYIQDRILHFRRLNLEFLL
jgi:hypothetical protein